MYRIYTDQIRKYRRLLEKAYKAGDPRDEALYIDLENSQVYFQYPGRYRGRLTIELDANDSAIPETGFYVHQPTFMTLCSEYPWIDLDTETYEFSHGGSGKFKLTTIMEEFIPEKFLPYQESPEDFEHFELSPTKNPDDIKRIIKAFSFAASNEQLIDERNYGGVALLNSSVVSGNSIDMYEGTLSFTVKPTAKGEANPLLVGVDSAVFFMEAEAHGHQLNIYRDMNNKNMDLHFDFNNGEAVIIYKPVVTLHYARIDNPEFLSRISSETAIEVDRAELQSVLRFFTNFKKAESTDPYIDFEIIGTEGGPKLNVVSRTQENIGNREIELKAADSELIGQGSAIVRNASLHNAVHAFHPNEVIRIEIPTTENGPALNMYSPTNKEERIATLRYKS